MLCYTVSYSGSVRSITIVCSASAKLREGLLITLNICSSNLTFRTGSWVIWCNYINRLKCASFIFSFNFIRFCIVDLRPRSRSNCTDSPVLARVACAVIKASWCWFTFFCRINLCEVYSALRFLHPEQKDRGRLLGTRGMCQFPTV